MGLHESWIVVRGTTKEALQNILETDAKVVRKGLEYRDLSNGWCAVHHGRNGFHGREELIAASRLNFALRLDLYDNGPFYSALGAAQDGNFLWEISVDDNETLHIDGTPPLDEQAMRKLLDTYQNSGFGDDYDIPPALLETLTGFDYSSFFTDPPLGKGGYIEPESSLGRMTLRLWYLCHDILKPFGAVGGILASAVFVIILSLPFELAAWIIGVIRISLRQH